MRTIIDTNILVRYSMFDLMKLTNEDQINIKQFKELKVSDRLVPIFILTEYTTIMNKVIPKKYSLSSQDDKNIIFEITKDFISDANISYTVYYPDKEDLSLSINLFQQTRNIKLREKELSFSDLLISSIVKNKKFNLNTSDKQLFEYCKTI